MGIDCLKHCVSRLALSLVNALTIVGMSSALMAAEASRPNILFILADDVGSEVLECYGGESYETPRLNQLAQQGTRFDHAYTMSVCHPTRICFLTGQYPFRLGNPKWGTYPKSAESRTIARMLKNAGYATAIAGKWQLILLGDDPSHPHRLGFDESCLFGWHEGPRYYQPYIRQDGELRTDVQDRYGPDVYCEFLIDFMNRHREQPFFAFYSMALCHAVTNDLEKPVPVGPNGRYQTFAEMVEAMDDRVGQLLDGLDRAGLSENTLVIFFTDNGSPHDNIDGVSDGKLVKQPVSSVRNGVVVPGGKTKLIDAATRVPLLIRWPDVVGEGEVSEDLIDVSDFFPTLVDLAGAELPADVILDGRSFADRLRGASTQVRDWVFAEHKGRAFVKDRRWKLYNDGQLFDLANDQSEQQPLPAQRPSPAAQSAGLRLQQVLDTLHDAGLERL